MEEKFLAELHKNQPKNMISQTQNLIKGMDDIIDLSLGDPDMTTPAPIIEAGYRDALAGHTHYTAYRGYPELIDEIRKFYKDEYDVDVEDEEVFVTTSANFGMYLAIFACINPGDEVLIPDPCFPIYAEQLRLCGAKAVGVPTYEEDGFRLRADRIEAAITPKTRAIIINSPCNPTGACLYKEDLEAIAEITKKHDLLVFADDIYTSYSFETPFVPMISIPGMKERTVTINSGSKNFVMTGARIGWNIAPAYIIDAIRNINNYMVYTAPAVSQRWILYGLKHRDELQPPIMAEFKERMFKSAEKINTIKNHSVMYPPAGTFYLFINIKKTGLTSQEYVMKVLKEAHVMLLSGTAFGALGEGYVRMCCTLKTPVLLEALERIEKLNL